MSNIERAAEVIEQAVFRDGFGIRLTAKSLADAGLLTSEPVTWFRREDYDADRLAQDVDDLWGTGDTLDLDTPDVAETPHDARLRMTQRRINDLYERMNHD